MKTKDFTENRHNFSNEQIETETVKCKKCGTEVDELAVFPGGICVCCHEKKFNAAVAKNGGVLPRPSFAQIFSK